MKGLRMLCSMQLCLCSTETQKCHRYVDMPYLYCTNSNLHYTNYRVIYNIYSNAWYGIFPYIWRLNAFSHFKFAYKVPNQTTPNLIALNQTMQNQSKVCTAKSPYAICALVRYKVACSDNLLPTFWDNLSAPLQGSINLKEQSMIQVNWRSFLFGGVRVQHHLIS